MNKGICFHFGYVYEKLNIEKQAIDIKQAGFDCVMTTADPVFNKENKSIRDRRNRCGDAQPSARSAGGDGDSSRHPRLSRQAFVPDGCRVRPHPCRSA